MATNSTTYSTTVEWLLTAYCSLLVFREHKPEARTSFSTHYRLDRVGGETYPEMGMRVHFHTLLYQAVGTLEELFASDNAGVVYQQVDIAYFTLDLIKVEKSET